MLVKGPVDSPYRQQIRVLVYRQTSIVKHEIEAYPDSQRRQTMSVG